MTAGMALGAYGRDAATNFVINRATLSVSDDMARLATLADSLATAQALDSIAIHASSSPDGPYGFNEQLARRRTQAYKNYLQRTGGFADELFALSYTAEAWEELADLMEQAWGADEARPLRRMLEITADPAEREVFLRNYYTGARWRALKRDILPQLRTARATIFYTPLLYPRPLYNNGVSTAAPALSIAAAATPPALAAEPAFSYTAPAFYKPHWYLKTNLPAWGMLWLNIAAEVDVASHWSVQLPVYYSGLDYFERTRKFRTFALQPEVRWWPRHTNDGFFAGAHFGMAYYNVAFDGDYRYQDHDGTTPALGGGVSVGYRLRLRGPWKLEFSVGAGVYSLDYDVFRNYPNGLLVDRRSRTFIGIDNAAVSLAYTFNIWKGGWRY